MEDLYFKKADDWRNWLSKHHSQKESIRLIFFKKSVGKPTMNYESAVEVALCYGWIDSIKKSIDKERYTFKFSPRKDVSKWSESNKKRVERLIAQNRMTEHGIAKVDAAKANGMWEKRDRPEIPDEIPADFLSALKRNSKAYKFYNSLAPSYKKQYIGWIAIAKRADTQKQRIVKSIKLLEEGKKLGMV